MIEDVLTEGENVVKWDSNTIFTDILSNEFVHIWGMLVILLSAKTTCIDFVHKCEAVVTAFFPTKSL